MDEFSNRDLEFLVAPRGWKCFVQEISPCESQSPFLRKHCFWWSETELHQRMERLGLKAVLHSGLSVVHDGNLKLWGLVRRALLQGMQAGQAEKLSFQPAEPKRSHSSRCTKRF